MSHLGSCIGLVRRLDVQYRTELLGPIALTSIPPMAALAAVSQVATRLITFSVNLIIARQLSPELYGVRIHHTSTSPAPTHAHVQQGHALSLPCQLPALANHMLDPYILGHTPPGFQCVSGSLLSRF